MFIEETKDVFKILISLLRHIFPMALGVVNLCQTRNYDYHGGVTIRHSIN
jgi:hypothetical protein